MCTASSDGFINVYDLASIPKVTTEPSEAEKIEPVVTYDSKGTRLTCVTLADGNVETTPAAGDGKRKRDDDSEDEDEESPDEDAGSGEEMEEDVAEDEEEGESD